MGKRGGFYGAIIGDIVGSVYEDEPRVPPNFPFLTAESHFTDDTVLTLATMDLLLTGSLQANDKKAIAETYRLWEKRFPEAGYGWYFLNWANSPNAKAYGSKGNGAAMRVSPVAYAATSEKECLLLAERSAEVTHNTPEGRKSAKAIALLTYQALHGASKDKLKKTALTFYPELKQDYSEFFAHRSLTALAEETVPEALAAFFQSTSYVNCLDWAIILGGDTDTLAAMAGSLAGPFYGIEEPLIQAALKHIADPRALDTLTRFEKKYVTK